MSQQLERGNAHARTPISNKIKQENSSKNTSKDPDIKPNAEEKLILQKSFSEKWKTSRFFLVRGSFVVLRSIWMVVMVVGGFIAWLISLLFI